MSLADITYAIDDYEVQIFGRDWGGSEHNWARARIEFVDEDGDSVGGVVFLQESGEAEEDVSVSDYDSTTLYGDDQIWLSARVDQFERILGVLRHERSVFVHWNWRTPPDETAGDGYGWISTRGNVDRDSDQEDKEAGFFPYITRS